MRIIHSFVQAVGKRVARNIYPIAAAIAVFLAYPNIIAFQDVAVVSARPVAQRWLAHMPEPAGAMVLAAAVPSSMSADRAGIDRSVTGSIRGAAQGTARVVAMPPQLAEISTSVKTEHEPQRINRAGMGDRVVSSSTARPPAYFSAGSVLERHSMLEPKKADKDFELAFVKPRPAGEVFRIAAAFHPPKPDMPPIEPDVPVVVASLITESAGNVLAYGGDDNKPQRSPFAAVLNDEPISLIPKIGKEDHAWAADLLPSSVSSDREQNCLTAGIYFEARGEPVRGQAAVAQVILNRVRSPDYPDSICAVVYQNEKWRHRCQFSFACDGVKDRVRDPRRWQLAKYVARETTEGRIWLKQVGSSTHYHATYVHPRWARYMQKVGQIGLHIFYRTFGGA